MKKTTLFLFTFVLLFCCMFCLAACVDNQTQSHTHDWSTTWTSNDTYHWRVCLGCKEIIDKAEHVWDDGEITEVATPEHDGVKTFTCTVKGCGKTKNENVPYIEVFTVSEEEWSKAFDISNFIENCKISMPTSSWDFIPEITYVNGNLELVLGWEGHTIEVVDINGTLRCYWQSDEEGQWVYDDYPLGEYDEIECHFLEEPFDWKEHQTLSEHFNEFEYNEETKSYEYEGSGIVTRSYNDDRKWIIKKATIKFSNGKIVKLTTLEGFSHTEDDDITQEYEFIYGGQVINFPPMENCRPYEPSSEK